MNRRDFLFHAGGGLGGIALTSMLAAADKRPDGGLHHKPKAKRVIQLFMAGAASHIDLFDFKPELIKQHGKPSDFGEHVEAFAKKHGIWLKPVFEFKQHGKTGKMLGEPVWPLGDVVDDIAFVHNVVGKTGVHSQGTLLQTTGFNRPGFPAMGAWISYGLGNISDNLPAFVVRPHRGRRRMAPELGQCVSAGGIRAGHPAAPSPISFPMNEPVFRRLPEMRPASIFWAS